MKRTVLAVMILALVTLGGLTACNKEPQQLTKVQIQQKIDSITAYRIKDLDEQAQKDLEHRMRIEVKVKADSINAAMLKNVTDSARKQTPALK